ncbi:MAG: hypothetical protein M5T61_17330 [Acidimicrobiia bacterium]|nr:hypothetical protein [Acidimicrobiia bacterium]
MRIAPEHEATVSVATTATAIIRTGRSICRVEPRSTVGNGSVTVRRFELRHRSLCRLLSVRATPSASMVADQHFISPSRAARLDDLVGELAASDRGYGARRLVRTAIEWCGIIAFM